MLGYALEASIRGYHDIEQCEFPVQQWIVAQTSMIFVLQIFTPLLLVVPRASNVLAPTLAAALFLAQWILLLLGWYWILAPSNCPTAAPYVWNGSYWLLVVYSVAIPLESVWYGRIYYSFYSKGSVSSTQMSV